MELQHKKIVRAKVHLQREKPFFAYLIMNLKPTESKDTASIGVDRLGNLYYNKEWVDKLSDSELKGVLAHEIFHLLLEHFDRDEGKNLKIYNIATDLVINDILLNNNFSLPKGLIPYNHKFKFKEGLVIEDLDKKSADEVYNEIMKFAKKINQNDFDKSRFDSHEEMRKKVDNSNVDSRKQNKEIKNKWKQVLGEATAYAKQQGNMPNGMERLIETILNEKINWKALLYKYITRELPFDYSYNKPSKRSRALGIYMPSIKRESIEIVIAVDTSGSIGQTELSEFLGEIVNISKSFNNIKMKLIVCDSEIKDVYDIANGSIDTILNLKIRGGGGTSHKPVYEYVKDNLPNTKFIINFTDGYTSFPDYEEVKTIWVLTKDSISEEALPYGDVIKLGD